NNNARLRAQAVDDHERVREHEQRVGRGNRARRRVWQLLDVPRYVVREKSNGAAPEGTELRYIDGLVAGDERAQIFERISGRARAVPSRGGRPVLHYAVREPPRAARL